MRIRIPWSVILTVVAEVATIVAAVCAGRESEAQIRTIVDERVLELHDSHLV